VAAPLGLVAFLAVLLLEEKPLGTLSGVEAAAEDEPRRQEPELVAAAA
jgi:hypothetical protein